MSTEKAKIDPPKLRKGWLTAMWTGKKGSESGRMRVHGGPQRLSILLFSGQASGMKRRRVLLSRWTCFTVEKYRERDEAGRRVGEREGQRDVMHTKK